MLLQVNLSLRQYVPFGYRGGQLISSEKSKQFLIPSQRLLAPIQCPDRHLKLLGGH